MLSGGWSNEGMLTFNRLAREVDSDRKDHGGKFEKTFKKWIDEEAANSKKSEKRKRAFIDTYNDLQVAGMAESEDDEQNAYKTLVKGGFAV
jgi:hypothetical protein